MSQVEFVITPLATKHVNDVVHLHLAHLRTAFRGYAGQQMLTCYYDTVIYVNGACGYVAEENGNVAGYVCGVWDPDKVRVALLRRHLGKLLLWGMFQFIYQPRILAQVSRRLMRAPNVSQLDESVSRGGYELRPVVVDSGYRGSSAARQLVLRLIRDAAEREFDRLFLFTENDNDVANAFYRKLGFKQVGTRHADQTVYNRYEISTKEMIDESPYVR